ncbi:hypothetical protein AGLY_004049 [Aphis glycines]|uniref:Uncharacterized protein n=1 Tax=Aphis glycines TaxID=307491 RepID=A0A6G0TXG7_APHGL|nr:hypothetical protein AGLY_004049 [Aphis glycines]
MPFYEKFDEVYISISLFSLNFRVLTDYYELYKQTMEEYNQGRNYCHKKFITHIFTCNINYTKIYNDTSSINMQFLHQNICKLNIRHPRTASDSTEIGNIATVTLGPPIVSSRWLISTSGISLLAKLDVQEITNSSIAIPASIKANVCFDCCSHSLFEMQSELSRFVVSRSSFPFAPTERGHTILTVDHRTIIGRFRPIICTAVRLIENTHLATNPAQFAGPSTVRSQSLSAQKIHDN